METCHDTGSHTGTEAMAAAVGSARGVLRWEYSLRLLQLSLPNATPEIPGPGTGMLSCGWVPAGPLPPPHVDHPEAQQGLALCHSELNCEE